MILALDIAAGKKAVIVVLRRLLEKRVIPSTGVRV